MSGRLMASHDVITLLLKWNLKQKKENIVTIAVGPGTHHG